MGQVLPFHRQLRTAKERAAAAADRPEVPPTLPLEQRVAERLVELDGMERAAIALDIVRGRA